MIEKNIENLGKLFYEIYNKSPKHLKVFWFFIGGLLFIGSSNLIAALVIVAIELMAELAGIVGAIVFFVLLMSVATVYFVESINRIQI